MRAQKGITLVALIITIIVLLILAVVTIAAVTGEQGTVSSSKDAVNTYSNSVEKENSVLGGYSDTITAHKANIIG